MHDLPKKLRFERDQVVEAGVLPERPGDLDM
jgi:hypothetical protein